MSSGHTATEQSGTVVDSIYRYAERTPNAIALRSPQGNLSYQQLVQRISLVVDCLQTDLPIASKGPEDSILVPPCIAIQLPPSEDLVVGILGVMALGACCIPIAADAPSERITSLLDDARPLALITPTEPKLPPTFEPKTLIRIDIATLEPSTVRLKTSFENYAQPDKAAVALYTSGTSGKPKAVLMTHQGFANLAKVHGEAFGLANNSRALIYGSPVHGNWINSLLSALANGATAVVEREKKLLPGPDLLHVLRERQITHVHMPPTSLAALPHTELPALRVLTLGGEALVVDSIAHWLDQARLFNCYGATESNWLSFSEITKASLIQLTIGHPIAGMQAKIVNTKLKPVAQGEVGELIMSGVGLALGYLNDPDLTREKFFTSKHLGDKLWYRSGDLGRALEDGQYEVIGRNDAQLSVRGYRVEPAEIEAALIKHSAVAQCAIHGRRNHLGSTQLIATLSLTSENKLTVEQLRDWLATSLPQYMIPARFRVVEELPLLANGKLDRQILNNFPSVPLSSTTGARAPATSLELAIASYWSEHTGETEPYLDSDFFVDGGDSLGSVKLLWDLSQKFGIDLRASDFLIKPTLEALAEEMLRALSDTKEYSSTTPISEGTSTPELSAPLTPTQERLWGISRYSPEAALYNVPYLLELDGPVLPKLIESSMRQIIRRHLPLRSTISVDDGHLVQRVLDSRKSETATFHLKVLDFSACNKDEALVRAQQAIEREANLPFDLFAELTPRSTLIKTAPNCAQLLLVLHHVVCDGWSVANLFRELSQFYNAALSTTQNSVVPTLATTYFDYARHHAHEGISQESIKYWENQLKGAPTKIQLPLDYVYPPREDYAGATQKIALGKELLDNVEQLAAMYAVTPSAVLLSAYFIYLNRLGAGEDLTIGVPLIGHEQTNTQNLIGLFSSVVPIRVRLSKQTAIGELLETVNQRLRLAIAHQPLPLEDEAYPTPARLLQTVFSHQNVLSTEDVSFKGIDTRVKPVFPKTAKFELLINVENLAGDWALIAEYRTALFSKSSVSLLLSNYKFVLEALAERQAKKVADVCQLPLSINTKPEKPASSYASTTRIHTLFEQQCHRSPNAIALVDGDQRFTYKQVNDDAERFTRGLIGLELGQGSVVGLCLPRSKEAVTAMLGVLKAGCAYMPLPPNYPKERLLHMAQASGAALVITAEEEATFSNTNITQISYRTLLSIADDTNTPSKVFSSNIRPSTSELAYVMYTSGTSGAPNPVGVPHSGVIRLARKPDYVVLSQDTVTLQLAPLAFDASTFEIWGAWLNGGCCVLFPAEATNLSLLEATIARHKVNTLWLTSSLFNTVIDENPIALQGVEQLLVGGEALSAPHIAKAQTALPNVALINGYGPTECTTFACTYPIPPNFDPRHLRVPIGQAIQNTTTFVLDHERRPIARGFVGELYLGGEGLAIGYLNNKPLTDQRFVTVTLGGHDTRLYRTGDLVVEQADGNLRFIGRVDRQVKIRGFRIEPQQIERTLLDVQDVVGAAVIVQQNQASTKLTAVVETKAASSSMLSIQARANTKLAPHERPAEYLLIDKLPTTANGKVDGEALQQFIESENTAPHSQQTESAKQRSDATQDWLITLWEELLGVPSVQPKDNFFDLGGNSLLAIRCMERIRQTFHTELPLSVLFEAGNVNELATVLRSAATQERRWSPLVTIKSATKKDTTTNLFMVHAIGGEVLGFADFARYLNDDLSVYALQARGALEHQQPHDNLSEMAATYVEELQSVQPAGPYRLGGLSMGGLIAHEMAIQLTSAGHRVDYLLIGDTWFFSGRKLGPLAKLRYASKLVRKSSELWRNRWSHRTHRQEDTEAAATEDPVQATRRKAIREAHQAALQSHQPGIFSGHVFLFRASSVNRARLRDEATLGSSTMGWDRLSTGGVTCRVLPGNHSSIFYGSGASRFAMEINTSIAYVKQAESSSEPQKPTTAVRPPYA